MDKERSAADQLGYYGESNSRISQIESWKKAATGKPAHQRATSNHDHRLVAQPDFSALRIGQSRCPSSCSLSNPRRLST
jgi:hypothetical protein